MFFEIIMME